MGRRFPLLLRRGRLLPHESLPSLVVRLAQMNYYEPVTMLNRLCWEGLEKDRLDWPSKGATYERLFTLAWTDPYRLHDATGHYFAAMLTPPGVRLESLQTPRGAVLPILAQKIAHKQLRPESAAQFCPLCLKKAPYHRVSWMPVAVAVCVTHKRLLVDRCPGCQGKVSVRAIVEGCRCRRCGADLREARSARLSGDVFGLDSQRFSCRWLKVGRTPTNASRYGLPPWPPRVLFQVVDGLVESIKLLGSDWNHIHQPVSKRPMEPFGPIRGKPTPDQSYRLYATAFKALLDWPEGFYEFLRAYNSRPGRKTRSGVYEDLGHIYFKLLEARWQHPVFGLVQAAVDRHLVDTYVAPSSIVRPGHRESKTDCSSTSIYISPIRAARLLGVSSGTLHRLVDAGFLVRYTKEQGEPRRYGYVRRDEVLTLRLKWRRPIPLEDAAKWLGLPEHVTVDLVTAGLLAAKHSPDRDEDSRWAFSKQELDRCYCEITARVGHCEHAYRSNLTEAARALAVVGLSAVDMLKDVMSGELGCASYGKSPALADLTFDRDDIDALLREPKTGSGLLCCESAACRMGVETWTFFRWLDAGLLSPVLKYAYEEYFDPHQIDDFLANHAFSREAAQILGVEVEALQDLVWEGQLDPVWGSELQGYRAYLFRRDDVEHLRLETQPD